jgi:hypothetical protein
VSPFITFVTPTYKRPTLLAKCLASVSAQTIAWDIEHVVIADHVGIGIAGVYERLPSYASAVHGQYVHVLADDDVLASPTVVEEVRTAAAKAQFPPVVLVGVLKGNLLIYEPTWPPECGFIDLGSLVVRSDVWKRHVGDYGKRYEGDFDFALAVSEAGHAVARCPITFLHGAVMQGKPEAA